MKKIKCPDCGNLVEYGKAEGHYPQCSVELLEKYKAADLAGNSLPLELREYPRR